jgi:hypothetical protein
VTVTVWECEGSNWIVHVLSKTMTTVGARESGALGSPVASWNNAFIVHSWRSPSGEVGTTDHGLIACPGTDTSHVDFFLASGAGSVGGGGYVAIAYVIENPEITVEHLLSTTGLGGSLSGFASGDTSKDITITSCDMDTTILIASGIEAGISSTIPLLNIQYMLTSSTNVNMRRGGSGTGMNTYALQVVKMLALDGGVSDVEYFPSSGEGITLGGTEARMEFDGIFDRTDFPGYEALRVITKSARGEPVQKGSILSVFFDAPRDVENLIGMGSTVAGTFSASGESPKTRPNIIEGEFSDRDSNYERAPAAYEHSSVIDPTTLNNRRISVESFEGMTRRSQVMRHMLYKLNYFQLASRMLEFRGGPNALPVQPGSRITYSHDVPQWGFSGRIIRDSNVKGTVYLDREVVLESGHTYSIKVRDSATNTVEEREISSADGTYEAADGIDLDEDLSFLPAEDDEYIFGEELLVGKDFSIMRADLEPSSLVRSLKGIEYIEEIYEDDFGDLPDTVSADVPVASPDALPASVEDLRAEDNTSLQPDGTVMLAAVVAWRHPASSRDLRESIVYLALGDAPDSSAIPVATVSGMGTEARIAHHFLRLRESHTIIVQPVSRSGRRPRLATCSRSTLFVRGNTACLPAPSGISAAVSGTLLRLIWEPLPAARMVEFRRGGWLLGVPFASAPGGAGMAVIADWASAVSNALADADALLVARAATGMGHYGEAGTLRGQPVDDLAEATLISLAEEDGPWTGTKTGFTTSVPAAVKGQPLEDLTTYLRFSGSDLEASYEMQINALAGAQDVIVHTHVVASQVHPLTIAEMSWTLGSPEGQRWTMEGPLWATPEDAQSEPCKLRVEFIPSITDTVPSTGWRRFIPGRQHFRRARFRVVVTRPSTEYDVRVKRFTIKVQRMRSDPSDYIESEVF